MASVVVQRFRECQNLLESFIAHLEAIRNITSQSVVVEEAFRRVGPSPTPGIPSSSSSPVAVSFPRCCMDPLGVLLAFPDATIELVLGQHTEDVNALLRALGTAQQTWYNKLQQAKEAFKPRSQQSLSTTSQSGFSGTIHERSTDVMQEVHDDPKVMVGVHALLAVLSQMHGCLQELILALRADLAYPTRAVQLSLWLGGFSSQMSAGAEGCIPALSMERALESVASRVRSEWEAYKTRHMVDEAWIMLAG